MISEKKLIPIIDHRFIPKCATSCSCALLWLTISGVIIIAIITAWIVCASTFNKFEASNITLVRNDICIEIIVKCSYDEFTIRIPAWYTLHPYIICERNLFYMERLIYKKSIDSNEQNIIYTPLMFLLLIPIFISVFAIGLYIWFACWCCSYYIKADQKYLIIRLMAYLEKYESDLNVEIPDVDLAQSDKLCDICRRKSPTVHMCCNKMCKKCVKQVLKNAIEEKLKLVCFNCRKYVDNAFIYV